MPITKRMSPVPRLSCLGLRGLGDARRKDVVGLIVSICRFNPRGANPMANRPQARLYTIPVNVSDKEAAIALDRINFK
jgi:hypothetical protein